MGGFERDFSPENLNKAIGYFDQRCDLTRTSREH